MIRRVMRTAFNSSINQQQFARFNFFVMMNVMEYFTMLSQ